jgi:HEAT repeat protein
VVLPATFALLKTLPFHGEPGFQQIRKGSIPMRRFLPFFVGLALLVLLGWFLLRDWMNKTNVPGKDMSRYERSSIPGHIEALKSPDATNRKSAATALWNIGSAAREATPALLQAAKDADPDVREAAVKALGRTSQETPDALAVLVDALQDDQAGVRAAAATSLAEIWRLGGKGRTTAGRPSRGPGGAGAGGDGQGNRRENPLTVIPLLPPYEESARKAVPLLTAALRDADVHVRTHAAEALAETGTLAEPAVPDLVQILQKDEDREARLQATLALGNTGPGAKAAVPVMVEKLRSEKADGVRVNTAASLGMIRSNPETVLPALVETFLKDPHPDARGAAMVSIGLFGPEAKTVLPLLQEAAKDPQNQQSEDTMQRIERLLKFIGRQTGEAPANP